MFREAARFVGIKEYVFFRLFGRWLVDYSIASATGLFNLRRLDWDEGALAVAGITPEQLSKPVPPTLSRRGARSGGRRRLGLSPGIPFVVGANDGVLSNLGVDAMRPGDVADHHRHQRRNAGGASTDRSPIPPAAPSATC